MTDLEQLQALADPLRLRILGALIGEPRTTKQVADLLGEKHNKLYYHVEALERAGLIQLKETRPKRGAVERYYQAVAAQFRVAGSALSPLPGTGTKPSEMEGMVLSLMDKVRAELLASLPGANPGPDPGDGPVVIHYLIKGSPRRIRAIGRRLMEQAKKLAGNPTNKDGTLKKGELTYALTIVFCRTDEC